jgi:hypothetical protein
MLTMDKLYDLSFYIFHLFDRKRSGEMLSYIARCYVSRRFLNHRVHLTSVKSLSSAVTQRNAHVWLLL